MANIIDLDKLKGAYDFLAETAEGQKALAELKKSFDTFHSRIQPKVNYGEFLYILRSLANQLNVEEDRAPATTFKDEKSMAGLLFQQKPGAFTRLGTKIESPALMRHVQGFNIRLKI